MLVEGAVPNFVSPVLWRLVKFVSFHRAHERLTCDHRITVSSENGDRFAPHCVYFWTPFLRVFPFFGGNFSPNTKAEYEI